MNVIAFMGAEAVTTDGVHWDIYVGNTELVKDLENANKVQISDIRYGSWSKEKGLKRGPIFPSADFIRMEKVGDEVYAYLLQHYEETPFPFADEFELWLLDVNNQPLALISSVCCEEDIDAEPLIDWRSGQACKKIFCSRHVPETFSTNINAGDYLTQYINQLAGEKPSAQWFKREMGGNGEGLMGVNLSQKIVSRHLSEERFPRWFVRQGDEDDQHKHLLNDFINWQSPWLLLLPVLDDVERANFEQAAKAFAVTVDTQCRLYPKIVNKELIQSLRVEALLRKNTDKQELEDEVLSPYYIELDTSQRN